MLKRIKDHAVEFVLITIFFGGLLYAATTAYQVSFSIKGLEKQQTDIGEKLKKQREDIGKQLEKKLAKQQTAFGKLLEKQQIGIEKQQADIVEQLAATNDNLKKMRLTLAEEKLKSGDLSPSALRELWSKLDKEEKVVLSKEKVIAEKRLAIAQLEQKKPKDKSSWTFSSMESAVGVIRVCSAGLSSEVGDSLIDSLNHKKSGDLYDIAGIIKQVKRHNGSLSESPRFRNCVVTLLQSIKKAENKIKTFDEKGKVINSIKDDSGSANIMIHGGGSETITIESSGNAN